MTLLSVLSVVVRTGVRRKTIFDNQVLKVLTRKMSGNDWKIEKQKYLNMSKEEKRNFLASNKRRCETVENIPTWEEYYKTKQPLPKALEIEGNFQINESLNQELAKKVSIFPGDITTLEVQYTLLLRNIQQVFFLNKYNIKYVHIFIG